MPDPDTAPVLADSVTRLDATATGRVVVTGSHGGVYAACLARQAGCRAAIFNDAGVGLDAAGVGGLAWLDPQGMAAAAVDHATAGIGNSAQMLAQGRISRVNAAARNCGVAPGMTCTEAAALLQTAPLPHGPCPVIAEARAVLHPPGALRDLVLVDSAGLVAPEDAGQIVVTGSHGAIFGGDVANALKVDAFLAVFNDAGGGIGTARLPALEARGMAAVTVAAASARIGDAGSSWRDGVISAFNPAAAKIGARLGMPARELIDIALTLPG